MWSKSHHRNYRMGTYTSNGKVIYWVVGSDYFVLTISLPINTFGEIDRRLGHIYFDPQVTSIW